MENESMEKFLNLSKEFEEGIHKFLKEINAMWDFELSDRIKEVFEQLNTLSLDLSNIKEKELYEKLNRIDPYKAIHKEDIRWIIRDYDTLDEALLDFEEDVIFLDSKLGEYIKDIVYSGTIEKREKVVLLLSHIEPLIKVCLGDNLELGNGIKRKVSDAVIPKLDRVTEGNIGRIYILAITKVIFAKTDEFKDDIDKRIPFRNNILHNGICEYGSEDIEEMYFILVVFVKMILISGWAIKEENN